MIDKHRIKNFTARALRKILAILSNDHFEFVKATAPVSINSLVTPLRYDIIVRRDYFEFFGQNIDLYKDDFHKYLALAQKTPYFKWFRDVARYRFHTLHDEKMLHKYFADKIKKSAKLYSVFEKNGFNPRHPITLKTGERILPTETGKRTSAVLYPGDGCHRIALLSLAGYTHLEPKHYIIKKFVRFRPHDNTAILIKSLQMDTTEYYTFLSMVYAEEPLCKRSDLKAQLAKTNPEKLAEFENIISVDEPILYGQWAGR